MGLSDITALTMSEAGRLVHKKTVSAAELVEATLGKVEETEPTVHAYAAVLADSARKAATLADREMARGHWRGPLHGIPVAVKDLCYTKDAPTEAGSKVLAGYVPPYDATVVTRLYEAGAIILGKTVTHEFAWGVNVPPTRNPWRLTCYPGGSSAGSGVAVSVRSAFGAIGTDTGGSIRIPAAVNGIVGLKPTFGRVSRHGIIPMSASLDHAGPLTRTIEDCALMLQAIAGYDRFDSSSIDHPIPDYTGEIEAGVNGLVVGVERAHSFYPTVIPDIRVAVENVIEQLKRQGARIVEVELPELQVMPVVGLTILLPDTSAFHRRLLRERQTDYDPATRLLLELGELVPATHYITALRARSLLRNSMRNLFTSHHLDVLLAPTLPIPAWPIDQLSVSMEGETNETPMAAYVHHSFSANITGQPALTVPCGFTKDGLPIGFQLLGRPFDEATLFRVARAYERTASWHTTAPELTGQAGEASAADSDRHSRAAGKRMGDGL
jgi:aspartyl-tRNA(Asn)/glutamyl-tRNA(Gln) amidotransferase subunit A